MTDIGFDEIVKAVHACKDVPNAKLLTDEEVSMHLDIRGVSVDQKDIPTVRKALARI